MKGFNLLCLLVLVAAAVSLACSQEVSEPEPVAPSGADVPTVAAAPVTETVNPMPTAISTEVTTRDPGQEGPQGTHPLPAAISTEVATPPAAPRFDRIGSGNIGGVRLSPLPQTMAM